MYFVMHASVGAIRTIISKRIKTLNYPTKRQNKLHFARSRRTRMHSIISRTHVCYIVTITHALQMQFIARRLSSPRTLLLLVYFSSFYRILRTCLLRVVHVTGSRRAKSLWAVGRYFKSQIRSGRRYYGSRQRARRRNGRRTLRLASRTTRKLPWD